jgi:hypothetical protein
VKSPALGALESVLRADQRHAFGVGCGQTVSGWPGPAWPGVEAGHFALGWEPKHPSLLEGLESIQP